MSVGVPRAGYIQLLVGLSTYRDCDLYGWVRLWLPLGPASELYVGLVWEISDPPLVLDLGSKVAEWAGLVWSRVGVGQGVVVGGGVEDL